MLKKDVFLISLFIVNILFPSLNLNSQEIIYPETPIIPVIDTIHGFIIVDNYRWLENREAPEVLKWTEEQNELTRSILDTLPHRDFLINRFNELWRYDDEGVPWEAIDSDRIFFWVDKKDQEKTIYYTKENEDAPEEVLLNPNEWDPTEYLNSFNTSRDGSYIVYGVARGGDENPSVKIMNVTTKEILPDTLRGARQRVTSWLPDNSGFYYIANPSEGEVPEGEERYWKSAYFHKLGNPADLDEKVFFHDEVKEYRHGAYISEDGNYIIFYRGLWNTNELFFKKLGSDEPLTPLVTGFDAQYAVCFIEDKILIQTDLDAPMYKVFITDIDKPERENWKVFIPENENDKLWYISPVAGYLYAAYQHNAYTIIKIFNLNGDYIRDMSFPTVGTGGVSGYWSKSDIWVWFTSFMYPYTTFKYDFESDSLLLYKEFPIDIDIDNYTSEQVWYESKDKTLISMFLVYRKDIIKDGNNPTLLTGYGGFNISKLPSFSTSYIIWLEAGGMIAIPNLRGGGEYGVKWHEAGMKENKQNVFDDFISAAEWLIENNYTCPDKLAISGGSNGGLLVGAVTVQRPDLFRVVKCSVPVLDMIRYHLFDFANIWSEELGSSENPEQFKYLLDYSPYHNVIDNTDYPAILILTSENDARVDPLHSKKMIARLQAANPDGEPALLLVRGESGHRGGTTLSEDIRQSADYWSFLMYYLDMDIPE